MLISDSSSITTQQQLVKSRWFNLLLPMAIVGLILFLLMALLMNLSYHSIKNLTEQEAEERLLESASSMAKQLGNELKQVEHLGVLLANQARDLLTNPPPYAPPDFMTGLQKNSEGMIFSTDMSQSAIYLLTDQQPSKDLQEQSLQQLNALSPLLKGIYNSHFLINLAYYNGLDSATVIFPWLELSKKSIESFYVNEFKEYIFPKNKAYFQHKPFFTDVYFDPSINTEVVTLSHPVIQQERLMGIIGLDITLDRLGDRLAKLPVPWGGYSVLINTQGNFLVCPFQVEDYWQPIAGKKLQTEFNHENFDSLEQSSFLKALAPLRSDASGLISIEGKGEDLLISWSSIDATGWKLINVVSEDKVYSVRNQLKKYYQSTLFFGGIFLVFVLLIIIFLIVRRDSKLVFFYPADDGGELNNNELLNVDLTVSDCKVLNFTDGPLIICQFNALGKVAACNAAFEQLMGRTKNKLIGCSLVKLLNLKKLTSISESNEITLYLGQQEIANVYWVSLHYFDNNEGLLFLLDVGEYKQIQQQLIGDKQRAHLAEKMKADFFQAAVSDANELLLELIKNARGFDANLTSYCQGKLLDIQHLLDDIRDMSDIGEFESPELSGDVLVVSLLIADCYTLSKNLLANTGRQLIIESSINLPEQLVLDRRRLLRLMRHLLRQIIQLSTQGDIYLWLDWVGLSRLQITLQDQGGGLTESERLRRFQLTTPMSSGYESSSGALGLGQLLTRQLVNEMRGNFEVSAQPLGGLKLQIELPSKLVGEPVFSHLAFGRILVVDDGPVNAMLASSVLEKSGYQVNVANSGAEALELGKEKIYDLVLMDIFMPDMDGLETTRLWRQLEGTNAKVPVIALTANALVEDRQRFLDQGMDDYLAKPYKPTELRELVLRWLQKK